ncbi:hypothetical protein H2248_008787 [Termitomyces sp. 'cryptogamus']|nr:hypothetical protein H2248_008787 [Termitomyces sp. 'cryptogamus']
MTKIKQLTFAYSCLDEDCLNLIAGWVAAMLDRFGSNKASNDKRLRGGFAMESLRLLVIKPATHEGFMRRWRDWSHIYSDCLSPTPADNNLLMDVSRHINNLMHYFRFLLSSFYL